MFLTSRPELPIRLGFEQNKNHQDLVLHKLPASVVEHDIRVFLKYKLSKVQYERSLPPDWPGNDNVERLVQIAVPLFISAATVYRFVGDPKWRPEKRLQSILENSAATSDSQIDRTYLPVLNQLLSNTSQGERKQLKQEFQDIIEIIILFAAPLSVNSLSQLVNLPRNDIKNRLNRFHSVLSIPRNIDTPVRMLHLSFRDYLLITESLFHINKQKTHGKIALRCLQLMKARLKHNICNIANYGAEHKNIDSQVINQHLTADLQYSCRYWVHHLKQNQNCIPESQILSFLKKHFLH